MERLKRLIGWGDRYFYKLLLTISLPIIVQQALNSLLYLVDNIMVGKLGEEAIAAVGFANQWAFLCNMFVFGLCSGASIFAAQYWGKRDLVNIRQIQGFMMVFTVGISLLFAASAFVIPEFVLDIYSDDPVVIEIGAQYLKACSFAFIFQGLAFAYSCILRSCEIAILPMIGTIVGVAINCVLNYILIFGKLGLPALGVVGAAIATVIANVVNMGIVVIVTYVKKYPAASTPKQLVFGKALLRSYFKVGIPVLLNEILWSLGITMQTYIYAMLGTKPSAAMQMYSTVDRVAFVIIIGIGTASGIILGNKLGEGDKALAKEYSRRFRVLGVVFGVTLCGLVLLIAQPFLSLYDVSQDVYQMALALVIVYSVCIPIHVQNYTCIIGILRPGGDTGFCTRIETVGLWLISIPLLFISVKLLGLPLWACFLSVVPGDIFKMVLSWRRINKGLWLKDVTV